MQKLKTSLDLDDEIQLHEKAWTIQRIGWLIFILILICAGIGVFGTGYVSHKKLIKDSNTVEYEQFGRFETQTELKLQPSNSKGIIEVIIPNHYLIEDFEIEKIVPEPKSQKSENNKFVFEFEVMESTSITFYIMPKKIGNINTALTMNNNTFNLRHFIYP